MRRIRYRLACSTIVATLIVWPAVSYRALPGRHNGKTQPTFDA